MLGNAFFDIVNAARNGVRVDVNDIDLKVCFEISGSQVYFTPAGYLAYGGDFAEADYLRRSYNSSINWMAACAAVSGRHNQYVEDLRVNHNADIDFIAQGAAIGGDHRYVDYLYIHGASPINIIHGYGQGGHIDTIDQWIKGNLLRKQVRYSRILLVTSAMKGLQGGGHNDKIQPLLRDLLLGAQNG